MWTYQTGLWFLLSYLFYIYQSPHISKECKMPANFIILVPFWVFYLICFASLVTEAHCDVFVHSKVHTDTDSASEWKHFISFMMFCWYLWCEGRERLEFHRRSEHLEHVDLDLSLWNLEMTSSRIFCKYCDSAKVISGYCAAGNFYCWLSYVFLSFSCKIFDQCPLRYPFNVFLFSLTCTHRHVYASSWWLLVLEFLLKVVVQLSMR